MRAEHGFRVFVYGKAMSPHPVMLSIRGGAIRKPFNC